MTEIELMHAELQGWPQGAFVSMLAKGVRAVWHVWVLRSGGDWVEELTTSDEGRARHFLNMLRAAEVTCRLDVTILKGKPT